MSRQAWHLFTGEYPPQAGGVGDYSALLSAAIAATGAEVHVWTSPAVGDPPEAPGVTVHRVAGRWSPADLRGISAALDSFGTPRRLLVQYTPNAWGYKGLNFAFGRWLIGRRRDRGDDVRVMFHEVAFPFEFLGKPTRWLLAAGQRRMARAALKAADHVDIAIPAWETTLRALAPGDDRVYGWRPVPSNIPVIDDPGGVAQVRRRVAPGGETVLASFGSFSERVGRMIADVLPRLLADRPDRVGLLIGRNGAGLAARMIDDHPPLAARVVATGGLDPDDVSRHLQSSDVLLQPYPDGVTTRRGSLMAALAHGLPTVTNSGRLTEPLWVDSGTVALSSGIAADRFVSTTEHILSDRDGRERVRLAGRQLYERRFSIERTVEAIVGPSLRFVS